MEQVAPRLANASKILTVLVVITTAINLKLDLLSNSGLTIEEYVGFGLAAVLLITSVVSSKERKIPTLSNSPTLEQQLAAMEETPTKSNSNTVPNQIENLQTKNIIESIIGAKSDVNAQQIHSAIGTLSSGKLGQDAKIMAEQLPAPHRHAEQMLDVPALMVKQNNTDRSNNVPLPALQTNVMVQQTTPDLPDLPDVVKIADTTEDKLPPMTDIDTLLNEIPIQVNSTPVPLPDLRERILHGHPRGPAPDRVGRHLVGRCTGTRPTTPLCHPVRSLPRGARGHQVRVPLRDPCHDRRSGSGPVALRPGRSNDPRSSHGGPVPRGGDCPSRPLDRSESGFHRECVVDPDPRRQHGRPHLANRVWAHDCGRVSNSMGVLVHTDDRTPAGPRPPGPGKLRAAESQVR